jgi:hypothetical protein
MLLLQTLNNELEIRNQKLIINNNGRHHAAARCLTHAAAAGIK